MTGRIGSIRCASTLAGFSKTLSEKKSDRRLCSATVGARLCAGRGFARARGLFISVIHSVTDRVNDKEGVPPVFL
jgi:hypothetical protein